MRSTSSLVGLLLAVPLCLVAIPVAQADPLVPPTPSEIAYLAQLHGITAVTHNPSLEFHSDAEMLDRGRYACRMRDRGEVGEQATLLSPVITQLAFIYLCPS